MNRTAQTRLPHIFDPIDEDHLTHWIKTEGVRRLRAMKEEHAQSLPHEGFWSSLEAQDAAENG